MKIYYYGKQTFGNYYYYLVDESHAQSVQTLTGKRTVNANELKALQTLIGTVDSPAELVQVGDPEFAVT
tara:strand:+ start:270 stop:476 length:207 start_codon:yes stop_codon:yes gene_type:complete